MMGYTLQGITVIANANAEALGLVHSLKALSERPNGVVYQITDGALFVQLSGTYAINNARRTLGELEPYLCGEARFSVYDEAGHAVEEFCLGPEKGLLAGVATTTVPALAVP